MDNLDVKIKGLQEQGMSIRAIGRELGISHVAVLKRLKRDKPCGNQAQNHHPITDTQPGNLAGNPDDETGNLTSKSNNQTKLPSSTLTKRGPEHCSRWQTCGVCNLEPDQRKMLEEMYLMGFPDPLLADYFKISPTDLASHAWLKHWWSKRKKHEDPNRKDMEREVLSRELWKTIMSSEAGGDARDRIQALKLAAQVRGLIDTGPKVAVAVSWEQRLAGMRQRQGQLPEGRQEVIEIDFEDNTEGEGIG